MGEVEEVAAVVAAPYQEGSGEGVEEVALVSLLHCLEPAHTHTHTHTYILTFYLVRNSLYMLTFTKHKTKNKPFSMLSHGQAIEIFANLY